MLNEFEKNKLTPLLQITSKIASLAGIEWFSCEIALNSNTGKFTVIDCMNDQFDSFAQSQRAAGVPDSLVNLLVQRLANKAWHYKIGRPVLSYRAVWFPRINLMDESI